MIFRVRVAHLQLRDKLKSSWTSLWNYCPEFLHLRCHPQYYSVSWGSLLWSFNQKAKVLVTSLCCILPAAVSMSRTKQRRQKKKKRSNVSLSFPLGITAPLIRGEVIPFSFRHLMAFVIAAAKITWVLGIQKWRGKKNTRKGDFPEFLWVFRVPFLSLGQSSKALSELSLPEPGVCQAPCCKVHARVLEEKRGELTTGLIVF